MMNTEAKLTDGVLTIALSGRIDSVNAPEIEAGINACLSEHDYESVVLDADGLSYISSAGLRVILRLKKQEASLSVINASSEVYDIFEMTGFTEIIDVKKAYRRISVDGCEVIGTGANGKVYRIDRDTIVKVYLNPDSLPDIHRERELSRRAFVSGVPTAIPYDVVRVGEGYGSVFELLNASSLAKLLASDPDNIDRYAKMNVDLLKTIHSIEVKPGEMPDMRETAISWADFDRPYLPEETGEKLCALVRSVPADCRMMHGDYHIRNIMLQNGEPLLIDMDTLCYGHPVFEFGSIFNAYIGFFENEKTDFNTFMNMPVDLLADFWKKTLELYFGTEDPDEIRIIENKARIVGYTRLIRRQIRRNGLDTEKGRASIAFYREKLIGLVAETESLVF